MSQKIEFLEPDLTQIRHQIRGIIDSYSNEWDLIAELAQNSVDAVREGNVSKGRFSVTVDVPNASVEVTDNGIGIDPVILPKLLRPFSTSKTGKGKLIGQKGVGINFIMFSSSLFELETHNANGSKIVRVQNASGWLNSESSESIHLDLYDVDPAENGTRILFKSPNNQNFSIFSMGFEQLKFLILTHTAFGDTSHIWGDAFNSDLTLRLIDSSGKERVETFDCKYLLPISHLKLEEKISIEQFDEWLQEGDRDDRSKRVKLKDKVVWNKGSITKAGRSLKYWSCFVPNRSVWGQISVSHGLTTADEIETALAADDEEGRPNLMFSSGLATSTKGMPAVSIDLKPRGSAGYVPNFFVLIEDPELKFDIGRKSIQSRQQGMIREVAYGDFRNYINKVRKYVSGSPEEIFGDFDKSAVFNQINELPNLELDKTRFIKRPGGQEATVAALFFEQIGKGNFDKIHPLISGYRNRYDLYARYDQKNIVIEFKYRLSGLFKDFNDEVKMFDEVDFVVVWEVVEQDREIAKKRGVDVEDHKPSSLGSGSEPSFFTHRLELGQVRPIYVIELKQVLESNDF